MESRTETIWLPDQRKLVLDQDNGILSSVERRVLLATAKRIPTYVNPNHLTALGVCGGAISGMGCVAANWDIRFFWLAAFGLVVNWFGDSLDGCLARVRGIERPMYRFYIDQISDVASYYMLLMGLAVSPAMHAWSALLALLGSMLVMYYQQLKMRFTPVWQVSHFGLGPTETRLAIASAFVCLVLWGQPIFVYGPAAVTTFDAVGLAVFVATATGVIGSFVKEHNRFAKMEEFVASSRQTRSYGDTRSDGPKRSPRQVQIEAVSKTVTAGPSATEPAKDSADKTESLRSAMPYKFGDLADQFQILVVQLSVENASLQKSLSGFTDEVRDFQIWAKNYSR